MERDSSPLKKINALYFQKARARLIKLLLKNKKTCILRSSVSDRAHRENRGLFEKPLLVFLRRTRERAGTLPFFHSGQDLFKSLRTIFSVRFHKEFL